MLYCLAATQPTMGLWMSYGCQELTANNSKPLKPTVFVKISCQKYGFQENMDVEVTKLSIKKQSKYFFENSDTS